MRVVPPTLARTFGGLLALAAVLAVAISYLQQGPLPSRETAAAVADLILPSQAAVAVPDYAVLDSRDVSSGDRKRVLVEIVVNYATAPEQVDRALVAAGDAVKEQEPDLAAITVSAFKADARTDTGRRRVAWMVWSPDGCGWDGTAQNLVGKQIFREPAPAH